MTAKRFVKSKYMILSVALLSLLAVCGFSGAEKDSVQTVNVSVRRVPYVLEPADMHSMKSTVTRLDDEREREIELLKEIADNQNADDSVKKDAARQMSELVKRMETEAQIKVCLTKMGIVDPYPVISAQGMTLILPEGSMENEEMQIRVLDAVSGLSGYDAADIKIILAKK